jgi:hypothetical protein
MKLPSVITTSAILVSAVFANANQVDVAIEGFGYPDPGSWTITTGDDLDFRVIKLLPAPGTNSSTHILIEGLSPLDAGSSVYSSIYSGIDVATGETQDAGVLYLNMPAGSELPDGTVSSPIVGVVARQGDWDNYNPQFPSTSVGGASGTGSFDGSSLSINLTRGNESFTGSPSYSVVDSQTIALDSFILSESGGATYDMSEALLSLDVDRFYGTLVNLTTTPLPTPPELQFDYDSLVFSIELTGGEDSDGDGVPDISDDDSSLSLMAGVWNQTNMGPMYGFGTEWGYSDTFGFVYVPNFPWVWQSNVGWLYAAGSAPVGGGTGFWLQHQTAGWVYANSLGGGDYYAQNSNWAVDNFITPNP